MIASSRLIVIYRDCPEDRNRYFGPFVSENVAYDFLDSLPKPLTGGYKMAKHLSPFNHDEQRLASDVILRRRAEQAYTLDAAIASLRKGLRVDVAA